MTLPPFLLRVPRALAVLAGWDDAEKLTAALTVQRDSMEAQLVQCRLGRQDEEKRHQAVVATYEANNARLRAALGRCRCADPGVLLDGLSGGAAGGSPVLPPKPGA